MGIGGCCNNRKNIIDSINLGLMEDNKVINNGNKDKDNNEGNKIILISNNNKQIITKSCFGNPNILQPLVLNNENQEKYIIGGAQYEDLLKNLESSHQDTGSELSNNN